MRGGKHHYRHHYHPQQNARDTIGALSKQLGSGNLCVCVCVFVCVCVVYPKIPVYRICVTLVLLQETYSTTHPHLLSLLMHERSVQRMICTSKFSGDKNCLPSSEHRALSAIGPTSLCRGSCRKRTSCNLCSSERWRLDEYTTNSNVPRPTVVSGHAWCVLAVVCLLTAKPTGAFRGSGHWTGTLLSGKNQEYEER